MLKELGSRFSHIPVTGFDNIMAGLIMPVQLFSVAPSSGSTAASATEILLQRIEEKNKQLPRSEPRQVVLGVKLYHHD